MLELKLKHSDLKFSSSSLKEESMTEDLACEDKLRQLKRSFNTNIPKSYMKYIVEEGAQKIGVEFEGDKDVYHVKVFPGLATT